MKTVFSMQWAPAAVALVGLALLVMGATPLTADDDQPSFVQAGQAGFVVSHMEYALSQDAKETGACPDGMTQGYTLSGDNAGQQGFPISGPARQSGDGDAAASGQQASGEQAFLRAMDDPNVKTPCLNPEGEKPDPNFRTVTGANVPAYGIDLDGRDSHLDGAPAPGTCAHEDFVGMNGERGIDNQFFRFAGCSDSFQSSGALKEYVNGSMLTGMWGILITLSGVEDIHNDDDVEVGFYANADPIALSPNRDPLADATYAMDQDSRFRATTHGRIVDGVLTTDPVDVNFHSVSNTMRLERPLHRAVARMTLSEDGVLAGYLAGYTPVEAMYDVQYGFRNGKDATGKLASRGLRAVTGMGLAHLVGHTCPGAYYALHALADADPNPETGKCTSISTQYRIKAIPAFVVDVETKSMNSDLEK